MTVTLSAWKAMWRELGASQPDEALFEQLIARWSEPHRHYHALQHLAECLEHLEAAQALAQRPAEVELALWFHDAIYDPTRSDNEERSAGWAKRSVAQAGLPAEVGDRVHAMVMATRHQHAAVADADTQSLLDIDLASLGASPSRYAQYASDIRSEYAHVPEADFRTRRKQILDGFLQRPHLYATGFFRDRFEAQARANIAAEIGRL